jgi:hypothetical protein
MAKQLRTTRAPIVLQNTSNTRGAVSYQRTKKTARNFAARDILLLLRLYRCTNGRIIRDAVSDPVRQAHINFMCDKLQSVDLSRQRRQTEVCRTSRYPMRALWPPSTGSITPVMNFASSEARNNAA